LLSHAGVLSAQTLPATIHVLIPFTPGGPVDIIGRFAADGLRAQTRSTVVVENRPGANGAVAVAQMRQASPDGGTLLVVSSGMITFSPHLEKNMTWDPARDLAPIVCVAYADIGLIVANNVAAATLHEFIALARNSAKPLSMGSAGAGNLTHAYIELFKDSAKVSFLHVPYKGAAPALADVMGGQIAGMFIGLSTALPAAKAGRIKVLAVAGRRSVIAPEIATLTEQGVPGVEILPWFALMGPRGIGAEPRAAIAAAMARAFATDDMQARLQSAGATAWVLAGAEFQHMIQAESDTWRKLIADKKISAE
jgi:tripartite-type tricarboxylate transporter receptor subunit TctC